MSMRDHRVKLAIGFAAMLAWTAPIMPRLLGGALGQVYTGAVLVAIVTIWAYAYYRYQHRKLLCARLLADGWQRLPAWAHRDVWACPSCGCMLASMDAAHRHLDPESSFCAAFGALLDRQRQQAAAAGQPAPTVVNWDVFVHPTGPAGYDSMTDDPKREVEQ